MKFIHVKGAKQHNLKNIDLDIPRDKLTVITGLSGSGKSSLAFDTLYAEGQRRYVESLSAYARQFLSVMDKPEVDTIEGLSPAISIEQKSTSHNPRSTVGTVTEIYDYLRLLYARSGSAKCLEHNISLEGQTIDQIGKKILNSFNKKRIFILAPVVKEQKGEHLNLFNDLLMKGYVRVTVNGVVYDLSDQIKLDKNKKHSISIVVDRLTVDLKNNSRLIQSLETCVSESNGLIEIQDMDNKDVFDAFSTKMACPKCGFSIQELEPRLFSFNSPSGACPSCDGLGYKSKIDLSKLIVRPELSLNQGAIKDWDASHTYHNRYLLNRVSQTFGFSLDTPFEDLLKKEKEILLYGSEEEVDFSYVSKRGFKREIFKPFEGIVNNIERRLGDTDSNFRREYYAKFMTNTSCDECSGTRLNLEARSVFINQYSLPEIVGMTIGLSLIHI